MYFRTFFVGLTLVISLSAHLASAESVLRVKSTVPFWPGQNVLLQDILEESSLKNGLPSGVLGWTIVEAERLTEERTSFKSSTVSRRLREAVAQSDAKELSNVQFQLPSEILMSAQPLILLESRMSYDLARRLQSGCDECRVEVSRLQVQWPKDVKPEVTWTWDGLPDIQNLRGSLFVGVDLNFGGGNHRRWVQARPRILKKVPVATRAIGYGEVFESANFEHAWRDVSHFADAPLSPEDMVGYVSNRLIPMGQIVRRRDLIRPQVIKYGDMVRVHQGNGYLEVVAPGVARQAGAIGERIQVQVSQTKKTVSATIEESGKVRIQ